MYMIIYSILIPFIFRAFIFICLRIILLIYIYTHEIFFMFLASSFLFLQFNMSPIRLVIFTRRFYATLINPTINIIIIFRVVDRFLSIYRLLIIFCPIFRAITWCLMLRKCTIPVIRIRNIISILKLITYLL